MKINGMGFQMSRHARASSWALVVACGLLGAAPPGHCATDAGRVSTRFELAQVKPLLQQIARLCTAGFTRDEAARLAGEIDALKTEKAQVWEFSATCRGQPHSLRVRAVVDELSEVDLDFSTDPELAAQIRTVVGAQPRK